MSMEDQIKLITMNLDYMDSITMLILKKSTVILAINILDMKVSLPQFSKQFKL
jgi:hypothetical protein